MYVNQQITNTVTEPGVSWFTDSYIPVPALRFPADSSRYCPSFKPKKGEDTNIILKWDAAVGASFYILQLSLDSQQFSGPGLRSIRLTPTEYNLKYIEDIRLGQTLYWRVHAHNNVGGQSLSSEIRNVTLECSGFAGLDSNPEDPSSTIPTFSCDSIGSDIKIIGAATLRKGDTDRLYAVDISYDCKSFGGDEVEVTDVTWEIDAPDPDVGTAEVAEIVSQTDQYVEIKTSSSLVKPHTFDLKVTVEFTVTDAITLGTTTIECDATKRILVEGTGGGGGGGTIQFTILDADCEAGCVEAIVTVLGFGETSVEVGDTVNIYDGLGCFFNSPSDELVGLKGIAHKFVGDDPCTVYDTESYHWRVAALCCVGGC